MFGWWWRLDTLPIEIRRLIASFYGGNRVPKAQYIVYNKDENTNVLIQKKNLFRFWKPGRFCSCCGNYKFFLAMGNLRKSYSKDHLSCCCEPSKYLLAFDLSEELQEACIQWVMASTIESLGFQETQRRLNYITHILKDYQCKIICQ